MLLVVKGVAQKAWWKPTKSGTGPTSKGGNNDWIPKFCGQRCYGENFVDKGVMVKNVKVPVSLQMLKYQSQKSSDFVSQTVARAQVWFPQDYRNEIRGLGLGLGAAHKTAKVAK